jgi:hypothetical protein
VDVDGWYGGWEKADVRVVSRKQHVGHVFVSAFLETGLK